MDHETLNRQQIGRGHSAYLPAPPVSTGLERRKEKCRGGVARTLSGKGAAFSLPPQASRILKLALAKFAPSPHMNGLSSTKNTFPVSNSLFYIEPNSKNLVHFLAEEELWSNQQLIFCLQTGIKHKQKVTQYLETQNWSMKNFALVKLWSF